MTQHNASREAREFLRDDQNRELVARMLAHGTAEARGYAFAVLANGGTVEGIEDVQRRLDRLKQEVEKQ